MSWGPFEEEAQGDPINVSTYLLEAVSKAQPDSSQQCSAKSERQRAGLKFHLNLRQLSYCEGEY